MKKLLLLLILLFSISTYGATIIFSNRTNHNLIINVSGYDYLCMAYCSENIYVDAGINVVTVYDKHRAENVYFTKAYIHPNSLLRLYYYEGIISLENYTPINRAVFVNTPSIYYMKNNLAHPCRHTMQSQMNVRRGTQQHPISSNANRYTHNNSARPHSSRSTPNTRN